MTEQITPLSQRIETAIAEAHTAAQEHGDSSPQAASAWDIVEELEAEASHQRDAQKSNFEEFCEEFPDAPEARMYDA
ncbi:hypothetical protein DO97_14990 [Neosynechococcus sphagnicola sy1]|uniref:CP12 domain-containing protein n=1 Tax=Neosynechococcus sphagnicola sy1 TaxID=1497020 RepID=A0A098TIB0_9CYAN|nr:Calvin cycle protein CP12 [Neosynechococcus sphagnicola]KGF71844.1 hypothetical protein DO97_14990 [Neosynechococcus sphagnicola sy1]